jgi:CRISPR/Cas system-associated exonuclease Cas4 (RecB family)
MAINRYSFSRLSTFKLCPKKHYYSYIEGWDAPEKGIQLFLGDIFHRLLEEEAKGLSAEPVLKEYEGAYLVGKTGDKPENLMRRLLPMYNHHYAKEMTDEEVLAVELEITEKLNGSDIFVGKVDKVVRTPEGIVIVRDTKTTSKALKYGYKDVLYNQQLLLYVPFVEALLGIKVHAIQIDEVLLALPEAVPLNLNGKPTADKRKLGLVLYEDYLNKLKSMGLDKEPEYMYVLDALEARGHPLFRRTTAEIVSELLVNSNLDDMKGFYELSKQDIHSRNRGSLCNYCAFKDLCNIDMLKPDEASRKIYTDRLIKKDEYDSADEEL